MAIEWLLLTGMTLPFAGRINVASYTVLNIFKASITLTDPSTDEASDIGFRCNSYQQSDAHYFFPGSGQFMVPYLVGLMRSYQRSSINE
jgi:hypothetical protein